MTVWGWVGFGALIFLAGLQGIPQDLIEAAQIDGCTRTGAFWRIEVPLLRPVSGFLLVWLTINALQLFDEVYVTTKGGPIHATHGRRLLPLRRRPSSSSTPATPPRSPSSSSW